MKILYVSSEVAPFCKTGGLGDVAGSLPAALKQKDADVRVVLPLYEAIGTEWRLQMKFLCAIGVHLAWRIQHCGVFSLERNGIIYYFIDNEYYFRRSELYGHYDDGERFAYFSKAVLEILPHIDFCPDVIHCNDWQTALIPIYYKIMFEKAPEYPKIKTVFTIHNIQYQGLFSRDFLGDVAGIDDAYFQNGIMTYDNGVNLMKAALICADYITTVSRTYAQEIQTSYYGHGLEEVLRDNSHKLRGILNGMDMDEINPNTDPRLFKHYDVAHLEDKLENKMALLSTLGLHRDTERPLISIISRLTEHKGIDLVGTMFDELMNDNISFIVLGRGDWKYEQMFEQMGRRYPGRVSVNIMFSNDMAGKIYAGSDMLLVPSRSEPCGLTQMYAMRYGTVPIVRETGGLKDTVLPYVPGNNGNGFTFADYNAWDLLHVIREAEGVYYRKDEWNSIIRRDMATDFGWGNSAGEYMEVYREIIAESK